MRHGEPPVHRVHTCLCAEPDNACHYSRVQYDLMSRHFGRIEKASIGEKPGIFGKMVDEENGQKTHHRAGDRVEQVLESCRHRFFGPLMQDQRHRGERQKFKTQIHRDQISGKTLRDQRSHGDEIEQIKGRYPLFHLHVFKRIEKDTSIQKQRHCKKAFSQRICCKYDLDAFRERGQSDRCAVQRCKDSRQIRQDHGARIKHASEPIPDPDRRYHDSFDKRYKNCQQKKHCPISLYMNIPNPCSISPTKTQLNRPIARFPIVRTIIGPL